MYVCIYIYIYIIHVYTCIHAYLSIHPSIYLSVYIYLSIYLSIYPRSVTLMGSRQGQSLRHGGAYCTITWYHIIYYNIL